MKKKHTPFLSAIALLLCPIAVLCASCTPVLPGTSADLSVPAPPFVTEEFFALPSDGALDIHTAEQSEYLRGEPFYMIQGVTGREEKSHPDGALVQWYNGRGGASVDGYRVEVSETEDFSVYTSYEVPSSATSCRIPDLYVQKDYYWRVTAVKDGVDLAVSASSFTTGSAPRNIAVDGVTNVRDLGGWVREDGTTVKQGMLYRTARLNKSNVSSLRTEITADGIRTMKETLNVKTEIDLRGKDETEAGGLNGKSVLGADVGYYLINMRASSTLANRPNEIKEVFDILSDENNYPVFFHCDIGTDRTGIVAFLVNALMGVSEEDLYRDYMFSNFAKINDKRSQSALSKHLNEVYYYAGDTLAEKTASYLTEYCGVSPAALDNVREILSSEELPKDEGSNEPIRTDLTVTAQKTVLPNEPIELDDRSNIVAWRRYSADVTEKTNTETYLPRAEDGFADLTARTDEFGYRNATKDRSYNVPLNGTTNAFALEDEQNTATVSVYVDETVDRILLYAGALSTITVVRLYDEQNRTLAALSFASSGSACKNAYLLEFSLTAKQREKLYLSVSQPTNARRTYIAALALTQK